MTLRCLLLTNLYPNPVEPERGIFVQQLARSLKEFAELTVVSPLPYFPPWGFLRRFEKWHRFSRVPAAMAGGNGAVGEIYYPRYFVVPRIGGSLHAISMFLSLFPLVRKLHRRLRFDVINAQWLYPDGVAGVWMARALGIPIVLTGHGCDVNRDLGVPLVGRQIAFALRKADRVTVVSGALAEKVIGAGVHGDRVSVIPNGIDPDLFRPAERGEARRRLGFADGRKHVLYVGQLVEVKSLPVLIRSLGRLRERFPERVAVHLVGEGPLEGELRRLALAEGVSDIVSFEGQKRHAEVAEWMAAADLLCLPSKREGCPNVILEALATGIPVVASRVGAIPELVDDRSGITVPAGDPSALAEALADALRRNWDPLAIRSRLDGLSWKSIAGRYADQFGIAAASRGSSGG
jgi:glycosyltransferase involved in cell wall biosynthesis